MFDWIVAVIARLGYVGVALLTFLENVFPPIPSELVIPLAGFVAARGELQIAAVIAIATAGSLAGATAWYVLGQRIGERRLRRWVGRQGKWLTLSAHDVDTSNDWFRRHGRVAVLLGRLVPGVRTFISLPAGFSGMPLAPFLLYSALGTVIWTGVLAGAGVVLQANFSRVGDYVNVATNILLAGFLALLVYRYVRCWRS
jgi:membrane protein DedA with SNARE-associated domain